MINLEKLRDKSVITLLEKYEGKNPYITNFKKKLVKYGKLTLTTNQSKYISENYDKDPIKIDRVVRISKFLGEELKKSEEISFVPEKILIEYILAETDKTYHIYGKIKKNQKNGKLYWIPKTQVLDDPYFEEIDVEVDFDKYNEILGKLTPPKSLFNHQKSGVKFLLGRNGCILADDMGLAKTMQSIIAALESGAEKILIVCPSSLKINWEREINCFCDDTVIIEGSKWKKSKFTIINYDILKNFHTLKEPKKGDPEDLVIEFNRQMVNSKFDLVIIDEAHFLKNPKSIRGKIMVDLCLKHGIDKVWLLTGTPIANRPMDFFNLLSLIKAPIAKNWQFFATRYCDGRKFFKTSQNGHRKLIWLTDGASNLDELAAKTKNIILRRKKEDVLDMPEKTIIPVYHQLTTSGRRNYENLWDEYLEKRKVEGKRGGIQRDLVELILLRKHIAMEAIPHTIELIEDALEQNQKVIVFTSFTDELLEIHKHFEKQSVIHYGPMNNKEKQISVDRFQNEDKVKIFIGNIKSAGVGITLTESSIVIFNSYDWVPGNNRQCEDRCLFGGQNILTTNGYKLIEDIEIGDKVYTHLGNFKEVIGTTSHLERKKCRVDINGFGYNHNLSVTEDHKIYVYDLNDSSFKWVEARLLDINNHLLTLKKKELLGNNTNKLLIDTYDINNGRAYKIPKEIELTNELLYAFGFFVAEGWSGYDHPNKSSYVSVCQNITNNKMYDASEYIIEVFKNSFGVNKHNSYTNKDGNKTCTIYSKILAENFNKWFGSNSENKQFPEWVYNLNNEQIEFLLGGYYHGDGYRRKNTQQATTISNKLISQLILLNGSINRPITFNEKCNSYSMEYTIEDLVNDKNKIRIKNINGYLCYPIKSLHISKPKRGEERVYDISVEDDHSFVCGLYNVHNCYRIGQKNNVTVYYQLFEDTISTRIWSVLQTKEDIIATIMGEKEYNEEELMLKMIDIIENYG